MASIAVLTVIFHVLGTVAFWEERMWCRCRCTIYRKDAAKDTCLPADSYHPMALAMNDAS